MAQGEARVDHMKCAHEHCTCVVATAEAIERDGLYYCSEACATGGGCSHKGCPCSKH